MPMLSVCRLEREELLVSGDIWAARVLDDPLCDQESCLYFDRSFSGCGLIRHGVHWRIERDGLAWLLSRRNLKPESLASGDEVP